MDQLILRCNPDVTGQHFREKRGTIFKTAAGIPAVLELRCKNRECCPPLPGHYAVHWFTLYGIQNGVPEGQYVTKQIPFGEYGKKPPQRLVPVVE